MQKETTPGPRFLTIEQVAEDLATSIIQIRSLLKSGQLRGFQLGGRGMWRIGRDDLEAYIQEAYRRAAESVAAGSTDDMNYATEQ
ncbi:helix-turn-helix domain-containing protein [Arthrobacter sp. MI7-26]|uniref:helix-turn-helix domain-containing protein n=1 Tax=Arthrobacter sp. MI7-26 TaxID=2993653 RepID=UPI002248E5DD|nr:helix-turn-helix domain-containing protein [Arthrobacter sp. MI7-26]MCX2748987.1 helix-turn-helix domain-containing protein [Arthrobacter sp. MI7-26]